MQVLNGITRFGKVCFEAHEIKFAPQNPCRMFGWSCSKVAIPVADATLRFFLFVFHRDLRKGKNNRPTLIVENEDWTEFVIFIRAISEI